MTDSPVRLDLLLDSLTDPFVYCDTAHVIRYMNRPAKEQYADRPAEVGRSIFECHNEESSAQILDIGARFADGEDEVLIADDERRRVYMRAVRDAEGAYIGYYERYEPR